MKVWATSRWATHGITCYEAPEGPLHTSHYHSTEAEARAHVEKLRTQRIAKLEKGADALRNLEVEVHWLP